MGVVLVMTRPEIAIVERAAGPAGSEPSHPLIPNLSLHRRDRVR